MTHEELGEEFSSNVKGLVEDLGWIFTDLGIDGGDWGVLFKTWKDGVLLEREYWVKLWALEITKEKKDRFEVAESVVHCSEHALEDSPIWKLSDYWKES